METFVAAYVLVWLGVVSFVARMGVRQRRLQQSVDALQANLTANATSDRQQTDEHNQQSNASARKAA
jgi:CcmD family protein